MLSLILANFAVNDGRHPVPLLRRVVAVARRLDQLNSRGRARRNVAHHYDLNGRLYSLSLDRDRQGLVRLLPAWRRVAGRGEIAKKRHIAAKLCLDRPDLAVLDIGCGWGGLALTLARDYGARVTGITLSAEQLQEARARAAAEGLEDRASFELLDYRALHRPFDRIVSVGMFEHVGVGHYPAFFDTVARCLKPDGIALLHTIGQWQGPARTNPWIGRYIFPGGYCPALSEIMPRIEQSGLLITDLEVLRLHYAKTLRHWRRRFAANRDALAALHDERFCRMWEFYLSSCELAFRTGMFDNFQIQLAHQQSAVPLTRDYITQADEQFGAQGTEARIGQPGRRTGRVVRPGLGPAGNERHPSQSRFTELAQVSSRSSASSRSGGAASPDAEGAAWPAIVNDLCRARPVSVSEVSSHFLRCHSLCLPGFEKIGCGRAPISIDLAGARARRLEARARRRRALRPNACAPNRASRGRGMTDLGIAKQLGSRRHVTLTQSVCANVSSGSSTSPALARHARSR